MFAAFFAPNTHTARSQPLHRRTRAQPYILASSIPLFCCLLWQYVVVVVVWLLLWRFPVPLWQGLCPPTAVPADLPACLSACLLPVCPVATPPGWGSQHDGGGEPLPGHLQQFLLRALQHHPLPQQEGPLRRKVGGECEEASALLVLVFGSVTISPDDPCPMRPHPVSPFAAILALRLRRFEVLCDARRGVAVCIAMLRILVCHEIEIYQPRRIVASRSEVAFSCLPRGNQCRKPRR